MNRKTTYLIPAFAAVFALMFVFASPLAMAEPSEDMHGKWGGQKQHKMYKVIDVEEFVGSIQITEDTDKQALKDQVSVSLSEAADGLDVMGGHIGVAVNENGEKFLVWILKSVEKDSESESVTVTIYVVDAANADNTTTVTKEFDRSMKDRQYSHDGERKEQKFKKLEQKLSESTDNPELDEVHAQFLATIQELKKAHENGDTDKAQELRDELKELRSQLGNIRKF